MVDPECAQAILKRKRFLKKYRFAPTVENYHHYIEISELLQIFEKKRSIRVGGIAILWTV